MRGKILILSIIFISLLQTISSTTTTYNFTTAGGQGVNMFAYYGDYCNDDPPPSNSNPPSASCTDSGSITTSPNLDSSDNNREAMFMTDDDAEDNSYHLFQSNSSNILQSKISDITWTWEGSVEISADVTVYFYLWNYGTGQWVSCASSTNSETDVIRTCSISDLSNYYSSGYTTFIAFVHDQDIGSTHKHAYTDFIKMEITYDNTNPSVSINSPLNTTYNTNSITFNVTPTDDTQMDTCLYSLNNGLTNYTMTNETSSQWNATNSSMSQGSFTVKYYCNDTFNNLNNTESQTFFIDSINPEINITSPNNLTNTTDTGLDINYIYVETNCDSVWYSTDGGVTNSSSVPCGTNFTSETWSEGINTVILYINDTLNQQNSTGITFRIDTTPPSVNIAHPIQDNSYDTNSVDFNFTILDSGSGLDTCWYQNHTDSNVTIDCSTNLSIYQATDGTYSVSLWANDSLGNVNNDSITYVISTTAPALSLQYPSDNQWFGSKSITFNYTTSDANGIDTCQLWGNWSGTFELNQSQIHGGDTSVDVNEGNFSINVADGLYDWNIFCNDTNNDGSWGLNNWTVGIDTIFPRIKLISPENKTYTSIQTELNYTRSDLNIQSCWYSTDGGVTNSSPSSCYNFTGLTSVEGDNNWTVYINDSADNQNSSSMTFYVDSINPSVSISTSFSNNSYINYNTSIEINITVSDTNLDSCWYQNNTGNTTFTCGNNLSLSLPETLNTIKIYANDSLNNVNNSESISFTPDVTLPVVNSLSASTTDGSQTFSFNVNISDTNINNCFYSVYNSSGDVDSATIENSSVSCVSTGNPETVSAFGAFTIKVWGNDSAGNQDSSNQSFTLSQLIQQTGGDASTEEIVVVIGENSSWSIYTENRGNSYDLFMSKGSKRGKDIVFKNLGENELELNVSCENIVGGLCSYVVLSNTSLLLPPSDNIEYITEFTLQLPEEIDDGIYDFNIKAFAPIDNSLGKISVRARVGEYGVVDWLLAKLLGKTSLNLGWINNSLKQFEVYNFFILLLPFIIVTPSLYFIAFKKLKLKMPLTFFSTFFISFILLFLVG